MRVSQSRLLPSPDRPGWVRMLVDVEYERWWPGREAFWMEVPAAYQSDVSTRADPWLALLLPLALTLNEPLRLSDPIDPTLFSNLARLRGIWRSWGLDGRRTEIFAEQIPESSAASSRSACFFSGGVDSFHAVLELLGTNTPAEGPDLVFLLGYDIPLSNQKAAARAMANAQAAANELGLNLIPVACNVRETRWEVIDWKRFGHGALLASAGLLLAPRYGEVIIPSSWPERRSRPWGSHPTTDPMFSTGTTRVVHFGARLSRLEKTRVVAESEIALDHLRVCWRSSKGANCQRCQKCYRTMTTLEAIGALDRCATLSVEKLDLSRYRTFYFKQGVEYFEELERFCQEQDRPDLAAAVHGAVHRSRILNALLEPSAVRAMDWLRLQRPIRLARHFLRAPRRQLRHAVGTYSTDDEAAKPVGRS